MAHEVLVIIKPSVGKGVAVWHPALTAIQAMRQQRARSLVDPSTGKVVDPVTGELVSPSEWSQLDPEDQLVDCQRRAEMRASSTMSDYMVHNRLAMMWVLTFTEELHGPEGRAIAMQRVAAFVRSLRRRFYKGRPFAYVYSPELHPGGHGWHVNVFLRYTFLDKHAMQRCWGYGNVWFTDFRTDRRDWLGRDTGAVRGGGHRTGTRAARTAARYGAKYAQKDWSPENCGTGSHRYERSEGFNVPEQRIRVRTFADALRLIKAHPACGQVFTEWVLDADSPNWFGPPMHGVLFNPPMTSRVKGSKNEQTPSSNVRHGLAGAAVGRPLTLRE